MVSENSRSRKVAPVTRCGELPDELNSAIRRRLGDRLHDIFPAPPNGNAPSRLAQALARLQEAETAKDPNANNPKEGLA